MPDISMHLEKTLSDWIIRTPEYQNWFNRDSTNLHPRLHITGEVGIQEAGQYLAHRHRFSHRDEITLACSLGNGNRQQTRSIPHTIFNLSYQLLCYRPVIYEQIVLTDFDSDWDSIGLNAWPDFCSLLRRFECANTTLFIDVDERNCFPEEIALLQDLIKIQQTIESRCRLVVIGNISPHRWKPDDSFTTLFIDEERHIGMGPYTDTLHDQATNRHPKQWSPVEEDSRDALQATDYDPYVIYIKAKLMPWIRNVHWSKNGLQPVIQMLQWKLPEIYKEILIDIHPQHRIWAKKVLSWMLFSFRPFTLEDLAVALAAEKSWTDRINGVNILDRVSWDLEADLWRVFGPLIDTSSGKVRFIHPSFREFLLDWREPGEEEFWWFDPEEEHARHVHTCICYLSRFTQYGSLFVNMDGGPPMLSYIPIEAAYAHSWPFVGYSAFYWPHHALLVQAPDLRQEIDHNIFNFLCSADDALRWCRLSLYMENQSMMWADCPGCQLRHAGSHELHSVVKRFLEDETYTFGYRTKVSAMRIAAENGHTGCVMVMLDNLAALEVTPEEAEGGEDDDHLGLVMRAAIKRGFSEVVKLLMDTFPKDSTRPEGKLMYSPINLGMSLHNACWYGHTGLAKLMIELGADVNFTEEHSSPPPLYSAVRNGHSEIAAVLLEKGAKLDMLGGENVNNFTALQVKGMFLMCISMLIFVIGCG